MFDLSFLKSHPEIQREYFISDMNFREADNTLVLYVPIESVVEKVQSGFVSVKQLEAFQKKLTEKYSVQTQVIFTASDKFDDIAQATELLLKANFKDLLEEINFTFLSAEKVNVWIKITSIETEQQKTVESFINSTLSGSGFSVFDFHWVKDESKLPSAIDILLAIKLYQPLKLDKFIDYFSRKYSDVNSKWLNRQLDKLIKRKLVVRDKVSEAYSLTGVGLGVIPQRIGRGSFDIARALDLGRRKW